MRKLYVGALVAALAMVMAAVAYAVNNTMTYSATVKSSIKNPTKAKPGNMAYRGIIAINTDPPEQQPDVAPTTTVFFDKAIKNNARYFPSCTEAEIDGKETLPAKCTKAIVGTGTARAYAGTPGKPKSESVREDLTVKAINGPSGKKLYLVVSSTPSAPVKLKHRVVPGTVIRASGPYGFAVRFDIPGSPPEKSLQEQLGLKISLTDFDVQVSGKARRVKVGRVFKRIAYLQLTSCRTRKLAVKAETKFRDSSTGQFQPRTSVSSSPC